MKQKYGLLGHPLGHSFSKKFHNERFERESIDAVYENYDLADINVLPQILQQEPTLMGLNVTIPYKQKVMQFLDELDVRAARIGAVNVVKITHLSEADGDANMSLGMPSKTKIPGLFLKGYNSDVVGFMESIRPMLFVSSVDAFDKKDVAPMSGFGMFCPHTKALVLGTGGASKAVVYALKEFGISPQYVSRHAAPGVITYDDLTPEVMREHTVIVNCSPVGMFPHVEECPQLPYDCISYRHICFDLIYNPEETMFLKLSAEQGAATKCGMEMLVGQALESYRIWTEE